ncbi:hypothetical protein Droror1_Dr00004611 [Drosera rotundifolia]
MRNSKEVQKEEYDEIYKKTFNEFLDPFAHAHLSTEVRIMRKKLVRKTFDMIQEIAEKEDKEDYEKFWENFGKFMKLGCVEDTGNHKRLTPLLRFISSKSEEDLISLDDYVERMSENQKAIYYLATDSLKVPRLLPSWRSRFGRILRRSSCWEYANLQKKRIFFDISKEDLELG